ncbi:MAG: CAP domain-containing protein [Actinomycetota bacterium]
MRNQGRNVRVAIVATLGAVLLASTLSSTAAAVSAPTLTATVSHGDEVKVSWKIDASERSGLVLQLERRVDNGAFALWKSFKRPRAQAFARETLTGQHSYRARLLVKGSAGPWSATVTVGSGGTTPTTGATPTTAPTPTTVAPTPTTQPPAGSPPLAAGQKECPAGFVGDVLTLTNVERQKVGAKPLKMQPLLQKAARQRTVDQAVVEGISHTGWVATILAMGYRSPSAEIVAAGQGSPQSVVGAWMNSAGHHDIMLEDSYNDSGVGCVISKNNTYFWTMDFGWAA